MTKYPPGSPSWVDLMTPDLDRAVEFYSKLLGWEIGEGQPEFGGYRNATLNGKRVAGLMGQQQPGPTVWSSYINTDSVAADLDKVVAAGGSVIVPTHPVGDLGTMGVFIDNQGAACGLWQPAQHQGAQLVNEPGAFCWNELNARDVPAATAFYEQVFGWTATTSEGEMPYTEFSNGGTPIAGMMAMPPEVPAEVPSYWTVYFAVVNCDASIKEAQQLGGTLMFGPMDIHVGRFAGLQDDQGAMFSIISLAEDATR
jgi:predicted enzyme related to lactoylglutathione lyase